MRREDKVEGEGSEKSKLAEPPPIVIDRRLARKLLEKIKGKNVEIDLSKFYTYLIFKEVEGKIKVFFFVTEEPNIKKVSEAFSSSVDRSVIHPLN
ncbi:MAG TPA: hypothetical protein ENF99_00960 [Candidatus Aenigmarchaeota archaeon]|nr:hypothetical protein [Candidatus Aenigmarchaeota archaeon]